MTPQSLPTGNGPVYRSTLDREPLPDVLVTIDRYRVPGVIECRGTTGVRLHLDQARITAVSSEDRPLPLRRWLRSKGRISAAKLDACERLILNGRSERSALVESGALDAPGLFDHLRERAREMMLSVFAWEEGTVEFHPGRNDALAAATVGLRIPIARAVLDGCRRLPDPRGLIERMGGRAAIVSRGERVESDIELSADERQLLDRIATRTSVFDLVSEPARLQALNARILYGLHALGFVSVRPPRQIRVRLKGDRPSGE